VIRLLACLGLAFGLAACAGMPEREPRPVRVLYLSQSVGFVHDTVRRPPDGLAPSETALLAMARDSGAFTVELSQDAREITPAKLEAIDVLMFSTTGPLPIDPAAWVAITAWIESGRGGFVGVHSATDTALDFENGQAIWTEFVNGRFDGHPWTQATPIRLANLEPSHPLAAMWPDGTDYGEEIYQYVGFDPDKVRVLQALDMSAGPLRRPYPVPVTWVRQLGEGRLFYTNLGHTPSTWDDPRFRRQIVEAILWTAGRTDAAVAPNPDVQEAAARAAFAAVEGVAPVEGPDTAALIVELQALHPDRRGGDATAWDAARSRLKGVAAE